MLVVPSTRRSTLGDHAFPVASARAWNSLQPGLLAREGGEREEEGWVREGRGREGKTWEGKFAPAPQKIYFD